MLPRRVLNNRTKLKKKLFCHIWDWSFYSNTVLLNEHCHEKHDILENIDIFIDAHRGRGTGAPHVPPQKTSKNWIIQMQCNTKIEDPQPDFLTIPSSPLRRIWKRLFIYGRIANSKSFEAWTCILLTCSKEVEQGELAKGFDRLSRTEEEWLGEQSEITKWMFLIKIDFILISIIVPEQINLTISYKVLDI